MRSLLAVCCLATLLAAGSARAEPASGRVLVVVLPEGSDDRTALTDRLVDIITEAGLEAVPASDVSVALSEARAAEVQRLEEQARQAELALDLPAALEARRQIVQILEDQALEPAVSPGRLAQAMARLAATEVEAEAEAEATRLFRRALALQADLALDATFSPGAREVFDQARQAGATLPPRPAPEVLERLCESFSLAAVLWLASGQDERGPALIRLLHVAGEPGGGEVRHTLPAESPDARLALVDGIAGRIGADLAPLGPDRDGGGPNGHPPPPVPWYRRWWVWFLVGTAVAGAATATGLTLGLGQEQVEVILRYP